MRHSYASHWLKEFEDKDKLLGYLGHATDEMLLEHYHRAVDRKTAASYWRIRAAQRTRERRADDSGGHLKRADR